MPELEDKRREEFALRYIATHNLTRAAAEAGISSATAWHYMREPAVKARVAELLSEKFQALHMTADEVLGQLARIARADIRDLFGADGRIKPTAELDENVIAAISGIDNVELTDGTGYVKKIKLTARLDALKVLAQYHKLIGSETQVNVYASLAERMEEADSRVNKSVAPAEDDMIG